MTKSKRVHVGDIVRDVMADGYTLGKVTNIASDGTVTIKWNPVPDTHIPLDCVGDEFGYSYRIVQRAKIVK